MVYGFTEHARDRMRALGLRVDDILGVIEHGEVIETYPVRQGRLLLGETHLGMVHVPVVRDRQRNVTLVVTVYRPDPEQWHDNRVRRR